MSEALTDRQQKLVESCTPMVFYLAGKYAGFSKSEEQDRDYEFYVDAGFDALFRAARAYDSTRGVKFITYAYKFVQLSLKSHTHAYRSVRAQKQWAEENAWRCSLDAPKSNAEGGFQSENLMDASSVFTPASDFDMDLQAAIEKELTPKQQTVFRYWLDGYTYMEMAEEEGIKFTSLKDRMKTAGYRLQKGLLKEIYGPATVEPNFQIPSYRREETFAETKESNHITP